MTDNQFKIDSIEIASRIHQAALDPHIDEKSFTYLCEACCGYEIAGFCPSLIRVPFARKIIKPSSKTKLIGLIAFPFGDSPTSLKIKSAEWAADQGVDEFEVVPNFFALSQGKEGKFAEEIAQLCDLGLPVRAILDMSNLTKESLDIAVEAAIDAGVQSLQTGNGFGPSVSKIQINELSKKCRNRCKLKAVGGIKRLDQVINLLQAGANDIGTSMGIDLMKEAKKWNHSSH